MLQPGQPQAASRKPQAEDRGRGTVPAVMDAIKQFAGSANQHDDITIVCLRMAEG